MLSFQTHTVQMGRGELRYTFFCIFRILALFSPHFSGLAHFIAFYRIFSAFFFLAFLAHFFYRVSAFFSLEEKNLQKNSGPRSGPAVLRSGPREVDNFISPLFIPFFLQKMRNCIAKTLLFFYLTTVLVVLHSFLVKHVLECP